MTAHTRWLELAAAEPAFPLAPDERRGLDEHLAGCEACAGRAHGLRRDIRALASMDAGRPSRSVEDRVRIALLEPRGLSGRLVAAVVVSLLALSAVGVSLGVGAAPPPAAPVAEIGADKRLVWRTDVVLLGVNDFRIEANGLVFAGDADASVTGDPGGPTSWSLELSWREHGHEQRLDLYFKADGGSWWIDELRVGDGLPPPDSATFPPGPHAPTPIGQDFVGDLDFVGEGGAGPVRVHLGDAVLHVAPREDAAAPPGGGVVLPENATPFAPGGPLHCSGVLQMTPADAHRALVGLGYRVTWRLVERKTQTESFWHVLDQPPDGVIWGSHEPSASTDGALIVAVLPPTDPLAKRAPFPADCPAPSVPPRG